MPQLSGGYANLSSREMGFIYPILFVNVVHRLVFMMAAIPAIPFCVRSLMRTCTTCATGAMEHRRRTCPLCKADPLAECNDGAPACCDDAAPPSTSTGSVGAVALQGSVAVGVSDQAVRITMEGGVELVGGVERRLEGREEEGGEGGLEHV